MVFQKFIRFTIFSNLFISLSAALFTSETITFFNLPYWLHWLSGFVFGGTLLVYTLHYMLKKELPVADERQLWRKKHKSFFKFFLIFSILCITWFAIQLYHHFPPDKQGVIYSIIFAFGAIGILSLIYSHPFSKSNGRSLRKYGKLKLLYLSVIWTATTGLIPFLFLPEENIVPKITLQITAFLLHRLLFIASIAFLFNIYDYGEDKEAGINTFAVSWGKDKSLNIGKWLFLFLNLSASVFFILSFEITSALYILAVFIPCAAVYLLYKRFDSAETESSFVLRHDGLMIIKVLLLIFATVISKK